MRQARPLAIFLTTVLWTAASTGVSAQTAPNRECSPADIELALAGEYAGPPCRFTQMPDGVPAPSAAQARPAELLGGPISPAVAQQPRYRPAVRVPRPVPALHAEVWTTRSHRAELPGGPVSSSVSPDFRHRRAYPEPLSAPVRHVEAESQRTVVLDEAFFASGLTGGVERPYRPVYVYRGLILIAADGETRTGFAGLDRRVGTVRVMDRLPARPPRAYPYD